MANSIIISINLYRVICSPCTTLGLRLTPCCCCRCCTSALLPLGSRCWATSTAPAGGVWLLLLLWLLLSGTPGGTIQLTLAVLGHCRYSDAPTLGPRLSLP